MHKSIIHIVLILICILAAYSSTFDVPFIFDDVWSIVNNPKIRDLSSFFEIDALRPNRYLGFLTFALNYHIHGLEVTGYHIVNLLIHIVNTLLVYALALLTLKTPWLRDRFGTSHLISYLPLGAGLLFAVHPLQTQAVTYIVQRFTSLATLFYLISLVLYSRARLAQTKGPSIAWYVGSVMCAVCAMKTKEIAFTLPVMIVLYELFFFRGKLVKRFIVLVPLLLTMLIIPLSILGIDRPLGEIINDVSDATRVQSTFSRWEYLATQVRVIMTYLRLVVLPVNQNLDYDYPVSQSFGEPAVLASFGVLVLLACSGTYLFVRSRRGEPEQRLIAYGIFWFFITLSVESSVIPIVDVIYEHRMYLPSVGVFLAIGAGVVIIARKLKERQREAKMGITAAFTVIILLLLVITFVRNHTWGDEIIFWQDVVRKSPGKARPYNNLGNAYLREGRMNDAIKEYQIALRIRPDYVDSHNNLGLVYYESGRTSDAIKEYQTALGIRPDYAEAHYNLGIVYYELGRTSDAMEAFQTALRLRPDHAKTHNNLGIVYKETGLTNDAIKEYQTALRLKPDYAEAHNNLGIVYYELGRTSDAIKEYQAALRLKPDYAEAHYNIGIVYYESGRIYDALREYQIALRFKPDDANTHNNLGNVYFKLGQIEQAIKEYQTALRLNPNLTIARNSLKFISEVLNRNKNKE